ncbi:MAG TPA: hypothetical protein VK590_14915, partial [Saprospiraceae bacterium]|nr:hypothetical protein [Saprospiraceae bacterium]
EARDMGEDNTIFKTDTGLTIKAADTTGNDLNKKAADALKKDKNLPAKETYIPVEEATPLEIPAEEEKPKAEKTEGFDKERIEKRLDEVEKQEELYPKEKIYTIEELKAITAKPLLDLCNRKLGIITQDVLFIGEYAKKKVVGWIGKLILAHQDGTISAVLKKDFNFDYIIEDTQQEKLDFKEEPEVMEVEFESFMIGEYEIKEPGEEGREFPELVQLAALAKGNKISKENIIEYIKVNNLPLKDIEDFYRNAQAKDVHAALTPK